LALNPKNQEFIANPMAFIAANRVINNQNADSAVYGKCYEADAVKRANANYALQQIDLNFNTVDIDFVPFNVHGHRGLLPRYVLRPYLDALLPGAPNAIRRSQLKAQMMADPPNVVRGYYFPYKYGIISTLADIGFVDIPKLNPAYKFAFTGAMNGCGIVVTTPPEQPDVLRVYHYQNEGDNAAYLPVNRGGQGRPLIPGRIHYWFHASEYAGLRGIPEEVAGFNFLHFANNRWQLCSVPLKQLPPNPRQLDLGVPMEQSSKSPFAIILNY
jgi:hypothetical protein